MKYLEVLRKTFNSDIIYVVKMIGTQHFMRKYNMTMCGGIYL